MREEDRRFEPNQILLVQSGDDWNLVAQDGEGSQTGVLCPPQLVEILKSFVSTPNPTLADIWRAYDRSKGAGVFFWDLIALAEGLRDMTDVPSVRRLLRVRSAGELCHNKWQARLMRLARLQGLDPEMIREEPDRRRPDFRLQSGTEVEVKTLFNETSIELRRKCNRISIQDADKFAHGVRKKVTDAQGQIPADGIVVVATWCDLTANFLSSFPGAAPIDGIRFEPGSVIVALAPSLGDNPEVGISAPFDRVDEFCEAAAKHLYKGQDLPIPLTGRLVGTMRGTRYMSIGRILRTAALSDDYGAYEISRSRFCDDLFTAIEQQQLAQGLVGLKAARAEWDRLNGANPVAGGMYSPDQINNDPRFHALFGWGKWLCDILVYLARKRALGDLLPSGRPLDDAEQYMNAVFQADGPITAAGLLQLEGAIEIMGRLTKHLTGTIRPR